MASTSYIRFDPATRVSSFRNKTDDSDPLWILNGGLSYYHGPRKNECWVYVPGNFLSSGAYVPKLIQGLLRPSDKGGQAAIIHDYLCRGGTLRANKQKHTLPLNECADIFWEAMLIAKVPLWKRVILYAGARIKAR